MAAGCSGTCGPKLPSDSAVKPSEELLTQSQDSENSLTIATIGIFVIVHDCMVTASHTVRLTVALARSVDLTQSRFLSWLRMDASHEVRANHGRAELMPLN
ncbi:hypothetical protein TREES_T100017007 [Tupaia chinensis]|uniref:Uncharacterized protein n=1 Tax=Tupaia chinensis TaxID=246437 RepID=L9KUY4_TUPCH|nr:hypothetical protein TREES_T100017007 [Tupaia chinensis]